MQYFLPCGNVVLFDEEDYELIESYKWRSSNGYMSRSTSFMIDGKRINKTIYFHRLVAQRMYQSLEGMEVDHIDRDKFNCKRSNLRIVDKRINACNASAKATNKSGFKGVSKDSKWGWRASIRHKGKKIYIGTFATPEIAARAYNKAALDLHGEETYLNAVD